MTLEYYLDPADDVFIIDRDSYRYRWVINGEYRNWVQRQQNDLPFPEGAATEFKRITKEEAFLALL